MKKKAIDAQALPADYSETAKLSCMVDHLMPWTPVVSASVLFPLEIFWQVCEAMVLHPEWNSSSIMRCDIQEDLVDPEDGVPRFEGYQCTRSIRRNIMPRKPSDGCLIQDCYFYKSFDLNYALVIMLPQLSSRTEEVVPFYHPQVAAIAFRYFDQAKFQDDKELGTGLLQLDHLALEAPNLRSVPAGQAYWSEDSRTYRTALQLLSLVIRHGKSRLVETSYVKRVHHDRIVPKVMFQDLYTILKEKYLWILKEWKEVTDPAKHVFEDVAIATFLICLWKLMYPDNEGDPLGGFVDIGCGNGLLVYILHKEGFAGYGIDLRARKSWSLWGPDTPLRTTTLSPPELCLQSDPSNPPFPHGSFLIGNHADELTPWIPLLAALVPESAFLNMPCCLHTLTERFNRGEYSIDEELIASSPTLIKNDLQEYQSLSGDNKGRYAAYLNYIAELTLKAGWRLEREALRVPSTKNWAFVGRNRIWDGTSDQEIGKESEIKDWIKDIASRKLKDWKPRSSEGKDH